MPLPGVVGRKLISAGERGYNRDTEDTGKICGLDWPLGTPHRCSG